MNRRGPRVRWVAAAALVAAVGCDRTPSGPAVTITTATGEEALVSVEIADSPDERRTGLMYRTDLEPDEGMLFLFEEEGDRTFWMKNTPTPLDMIFIGTDGRIVGIREDTEPYSERPVGVDRPSRAVLEVPTGFVARHDIEAGDRVTYHGVDSPLAP